MAAMCRGIVGFCAALIIHAFLGIQLTDAFAGKLYRYFLNVDF